MTHHAYEYLLCNQDQSTYIMLAMRLLVFCKDSATVWHSSLLCQVQQAYWLWRSLWGRKGSHLWRLLWACRQRHLQPFCPIHPVRYGTDCYQEVCSRLSWYLQSLRKQIRAVQLSTWSEQGAAWWLCLHARQSTLSTKKLYWLQVACLVFEDMQCFAGWMQLNQSSSICQISISCPAQWLQARYISLPSSSLYRQSIVCSQAFAPCQVSASTLIQRE